MWIQKILGMKKIRLLIIAVLLSTVITPLCGGCYVYDPSYNPYYLTDPYAYPASNYQLKKQARERKRQIDETNYQLREINRNLELQRFDDLLWGRH